MSKWLWVKYHDADALIFSIFSLWFTQFQRIKSTSQEEEKYKAIKGHCSKKRLVTFSMLKIVYMMHHNQLDDLMIS